MARNNTEIVYKIEEMIKNITKNLKRRLRKKIL